MIAFMVYSGDLLRGKGEIFSQKPAQQARRRLTTPNAFYDSFGGTTQCHYACIDGSRSGGKDANGNDIRVVDAEVPRIHGGLNDGGEPFNGQQQAQDQADILNQHQTSTHQRPTHYIGYLNPDEYYQDTSIDIQRTGRPRQSTFRIHHKTDNCV